MNKNDKDFVHTEGVRAGKRIYYFDVKKSHNGDKFVCITESKKIIEGESDSQTVRFEKHKIFLYKEDYEKFLDALNRSIDIASGKVTVPSEEKAGELGDEIGFDSSEPASPLNDNELKIDLDF